MGKRRVVTVLVVLGVIAGFGYWLGHRVDEVPLPRFGADCTVAAGGRVSLDSEQMANAATIAAVGVRLEMPDRGVVVALATALQESKLRNLPHLGAGNDHDSVGLFQQRPSQGWGSAEEISEPRYAAERFYRALRDVPGWRDLRVTEAAQRVQRSAYPEAYDKWADDAGVLATGLLGHEPGSVSCRGPDDDPALRGEAAAAALGDTLAQDWGTPAAAAAPDQEPAGALRLTGADATPGLTVAAGDQRAGWRYAHWLVSHAAPHGVTRVRFADLEWTAAAGDWTTVDATVDEVLAEVVRSS